MIFVMKNIYSGYNYWFNENLDHRTKDLFLMGSPWPVIGIVVAYLFIVNGYGQRWMKDKPPFKLKTTIAAYNIFQVVSNIYVFLMVSFISWKQENFLFFCIPLPRDDFSEIGLTILRVSYFVYFLKVIDLLDTIFFILRKKNNQVTFLHIYHHAGMVLMAYTYMKLYSGGSYATMLAFLNSFVHAVMYSYYFLTSYKPEIKQTLWWKKHITQMQLLQFILLFSYCSIALTFSECRNPKLFLWIGLFQNAFLMILFSDFYYKAYIMKKPNKVKA